MPSRWLREAVQEHASSQSAPWISLVRVAFQLPYAWEPDLREHVQPMYVLHCYDRVQYIWDAVLCNHMKCRVMITTNNLIHRYPRISHNFKTQDRLPCTSFKQCVTRFMAMWNILCSYIRLRKVVIYYRLKNVTNKNTVIFNFCKIITSSCDVWHSNRADKRT